MPIFKKDEKPKDDIEEKIFLAVLSGIISNRGAVDSEGKPAIGYVKEAREFAKQACN